MVGTAADEPLRKVHSQRDGSVAIIRVDNPPVNALSQGVRAALLEAFNTFAADGQVECIVLVGGGGRFIAGADISELNRPPAAPALRDVISAMEACPKPIIAAMEAMALGGGLELALACDVRIAKRGTVLGFPEVKLGIIPGAGGTQRLPRQVGPAKAIELISSGRNLAIEDAHALSIVDEVVEGPPLARALERAAGAAKRRLSELLVPLDTPAAVETAEDEARRKWRGAPAVEAAVRAVKTAAALTFKDGIELEKELFLQLRDSAAAIALRYLFLAEREAATCGALTAKPRVITSAVVLGGGTMGSGIAVALRQAGLQVSLVERDEQALEAARSRIGQISSRKSSAAGRDPNSPDPITLTTDWRPLGAADLIIEAVFEDMAVKSELFTRLGRQARPGTLLATNTSFLDVNRLAELTPRPQDVLGLHFFSPAHVMKLLEIVRGRRTSDEAVTTALGLARLMQKVAVVAGVCDGFIVNRIAQVYRRQCEYMLEEGAWPEDIDSALEEFGFAMGPFAVADLAGLDISWARRRSIAGNRDPRERYVAVADALCEAGRFGQKNGAGWYRYEPGSRRRKSDEGVHRLVAAASAARGLQRRPFTAAEIRGRALAAIVNEAALVLEDGIAQRVSDIDVAFVNGLGFPRWRGGPMHWAAQQAPLVLQAQIDAVERATGFGFRRAQTLTEVLAPLRRNALS
jgi:3-hydroxyacyl-CoA dehydrogenase